MELLKPDRQTLILRRTIKAPRKQVYAAWTQPEHLLRWWGAGPEYEPVIAELELKPGGAYRFGMRHKTKGVRHIATGIFKEIVPDTKLVLTWTWEGKAQIDTQVTIEFQDAPGGTLLTLTHTGFPAEPMRDDHGQGWSGAMENLARACER
ncbi:MAG: activator of HSP90 ATPase [Planctomycetota bacterium]